MSLSEQLGEWWPLLGDEFSKPYMFELTGKLVPSIKEGTIQPPKEMIFRAFKLCPPSKLKVVIMGQDPYPYGEADGLAFSSKREKIPKSLAYIFGELAEEGFGIRKKASLEDWAEQGVLLLNTVLTTELRDTMAHSKVGWDIFIKAVLKVINNLKQPFVVMAWGKPAQKIVKENIQFLGPGHKNRMYLEWYHPNAGTYKPSNSFNGCGHFKQANEWLEKMGEYPILWNVTKSQQALQSL